MLFISTFRGKIGVVCILGVFIFIIKNMMGGLSLGYILSHGWILLALLFMFGISFLIPDIVYLMTKPEDVWARWGTALRIYGPEDCKYVNFEEVYLKTRYACTRDESGRRVATTLMRCTCRDFKKNKRPCLHMHKLAEKLNVYDIR